MDIFGDQLDKGFIWNFMLAIAYTLKKQRHALKKASVL